jgi:hypothetical protein
MVQPGMVFWLWLTCVPSVAQSKDSARDSMSGDTCNTRVIHVVY